MLRQLYIKEITNYLTSDLYISALLRTNSYYWKFAPSKKKQNSQLDR